MCERIEESFECIPHFGGVEISLSCVWFLSETAAVVSLKLLIVGMLRRQLEVCRNGREKVMNVMKTKLDECTQACPLMEGRVTHIGR